MVRSIKLKGLVEGENARVGAYYLPYAKDPARTVGFAIRSASDDVAATKSAVERALATIDPEVQLFDSFAMRERVDRSLDSRRAPMLLLVMFGGVALLLAALGIYGVLAYQVGLRTQGNRHQDRARQRRPRHPPAGAARSDHAGARRPRRRVWPARWRCAA